MLAETAGAVVVLAVHVIGDCAADGDVARARRDRQKPAAWYGEVKNLGKQNTGFTAQYTGCRIEGDEPVEPACVQQRTAVIEAYIAVAAAVAIGEHRAFHLWQSRITPI